MINVLKWLASGNYWLYELDDGGKGIVKAETNEEALKKLKDAYKKHYSEDTMPDFRISPIEGGYFEDTPDVIELYEN